MHRFFSLPFIKCHSAAILTIIYSLLMRPRTSLPLRPSRKAVKLSRSGTEAPPLLAGPSQAMTLPGEATVQAAYRMKTHYKLDLMLSAEDEKDI